MRRDKMKLKQEKKTKRPQHIVQNMIKDLTTEIGSTPTKKAKFLIKIREQHQEKVREDMYVMHVMNQGTKLQNALGLKKNPKKIQDTKAENMKIEDMKTEDMKTEDMKTEDMKKK